jgi:hypothetical protein
MSGVISYPIPPYQNVPIDSDAFQPSMFFISGVTLGATTTITTTTNMNYVLGQLVRLLIPPYSGCRQLNQREGFVISIPSSNQVVVNIDSSQFVDAFKSSTAPTQPQIVAVGDVNNGFTNPNGAQNVLTSIPGSFQNISPN